MDNKSLRRRPEYLQLHSLHLSLAEYGIFLSIMAGLATGIGALPLLLLRRRISDFLIDMALGFAAGVMLSAAAFSLIEPALKRGGAPALSAGIILGLVFVDVIDKKIPHDHFVKGHEGPGYKSSSNNILLFVIAIAIHNFPEGLAVGVGGFSKEALSLTYAIGIQNVLEGLAVAASLIAAGYGIGYASWVAFLTGLVEPFGAVIGVTMVNFSAALLPYALAFAGGAMLFVISDEVIPETHMGNHQRPATYAIIFGFMLMTILDYLFG
jgi:ZIP family zinc transporter